MSLKAIHHYEERTLPGSDGKIAVDGPVVVVGSLVHGLGDAKGERSAGVRVTQGFSEVVLSGFKGNSFRP